MTQQGINNASMLKVGTILRGTYRIDSYLSSGGFGNTYVATNVEFDERVAIKEFFMKGVTQRDDNQTTVSVSNSENTNSFQEQKEKFKKEARRLRKLQNEHIVKVHDMFDENGTAYYVMDYVDGENLSERLKRTGKPMSEQEVCAILPQILDALKAVHNEGFCHLDIKPSNIMLDKGGKIKLIDFGASKQLGANGTLTTNAPTAFAQTPGYAPREQMEQNLDKIGPWTDIYALGATLYNLLTNKRPPMPTDIDDDMSEDKHLALPFPESVGGLKFLVLQMMKTNRLQRPQNIDAIISADKIMKEEPKQTPKSAKTPQSNSANDDETTIISESLEQEINPIISETISSEKKSIDYIIQPISFIWISLISVIFVGVKLFPISYAICSESNLSDIENIQLPATSISFITKVPLLYSLYKGLSYTGKYIPSIIISLMILDLVLAIFYFLDVLFYGFPFLDIYAYFAISILTFALGVIWLKSFKGKITTLAIIYMTYGIYVFYYGLDDTLYTSFHNFTLYFLFGELLWISATWWMLTRKPIGTKKSN